jgi:hypothetical protein
MGPEGAVDTFSSKAPLSHNVIHKEKGSILEERWVLGL